MNTIEYLNATKKKLGISSDYALAKAIGTTRSNMSSLINGKTTMSDETARKVAEILGVHAGIVVLDMHRERASSPADVTLWNEIYKGFHLLLQPAKMGRMLNF